VKRQSTANYDHVTKRQVAVEQNQSEAEQSVVLSPLDFGKSKPLLKSRFRVNTVFGQDSLRMRHLQEPKLIDNTHRIPVKNRRRSNMLEE
jgi:hypothetical protein